MAKKPHYQDPRREVIVSITLADVVGKLEEEGINTSSLTEEEIEDVETFSTEFLSEYLYHIAQHLEVGQKVPLFAIVRLLAEWIHMQEDGHACH